MVTQVQSNTYAPSAAGLIPAEAIDALAHQIARQFDPERIILFGSHAYGQPTPDSDVDIMVIADTNDQSGLERAIKDNVKFNYTLDLHVRTPAYFAERLALGDFFIAQIAEAGRVLYDSGRRLLPDALAHQPVQGPVYEQVGGAYVNKLTAEWVKKAEHDLLQANLAMQYGNDELNDGVCYHSQQCAEKYFKAYLQERGVRSGKTHALDKRLAICETVDPNFAQLRPALSGRLKDYAIDPPYPGTDPTPSETQIAYHNMMEVRTFIRAKLGILSQEQAEIWDNPSAYSA